jgi:hypothetical protein
MLFKRLSLAASLAAAFALSLAPVGIAPAQAADLTITATSVVPGSDAKKETGTAGEAVTAGQPVYRAAATGRYFKSDANSATAEVRGVRGIALNAASAGQPLTIQTGGSLTLGATLTVASGYYLSGTAGGIAPVADLATGIYPVLLGFATTTGVLKLSIVAAGVAVP